MNMRIHHIALLIYGMMALFACECSPNVDRGTDIMMKTEFIYDSLDVEFPSCHASTIVETPSGLVAAWFGGTHEKHKDVGIWLSRQEQGTWTIPVEIANGIQNDTFTDDIQPRGDMSAKWRAFGWNVIEIDGHNMSQVVAALEEAKTTKGVPTIINAKTVKGKGVSFMENVPAWHGKAPNPEQAEIALSEIRS